MELDTTVRVTVPLQRTLLFSVSNGTKRTNKLPETANGPYLSHWRVEPRKTESHTRVPNKFNRCPTKQALVCHFHSCGKLESSGRSRRDGKESLGNVRELIKGDT